MNKKVIEKMLLVFALTTIMWCTMFGYVIGVIDEAHKTEIIKLKNK